jgi:uncharacterized protein YdhG (YjbR/CyaY superfamily)
MPGTNETMPKQTPKKTAPKAKAKAPKSKAPNPAGVDAWLAKLPDDQREALERLRQQIRAAAPEAVETIAYGVPMFYMGTTQLLGFGAFTHHVTFGVGHETLDTMRDALEGYDVLKDTIRFTPDKPLSAAIVKQLVRTRVAQYADGKG